MAKKIDYKTLRAAKRMNQHEFWTRIGVTQSGGSRYESGRSVPKPAQTLCTLAYGKPKEAMEEFARLRGTTVIALRRATTMNIKIKKLSPLAKMPTYATDGAGWFDLYATNQVALMVHEGWPVEVGTGLAFEIPPGHGMFILSRSGHGFKFDTRLSNCVGCIDSDYRGEVKVKLTCDVERENAMPMSIMPGDRVAQACILPLPRICFEWSDELGATERGEGGFGSTGK